MKKAAASKKGKKNVEKEKTVKEEEEEHTAAPNTFEYDTMDKEMLLEVTEMLHQQLEKLQLDRNYVQLERDTIQSYYEITQKEANDLNMQIVLKENEMENLEENHRVEVRVYIQKVKHLEYEHQNNVVNLQEDHSEVQMNERQYLTAHTTQIKKNKENLLLQKKETELINLDDITQLEVNTSKNLQKVREQLTETNHKLQVKYQQQLQNLISDLKLKQKVEIFEMLEKKNAHINSLISNHEVSFNEIKKYYNEITIDNIKLIHSLQNEIAEMKKEMCINNKLITEIMNENIKLSEPLKETLKKVEKLQFELKEEKKEYFMHELVLKRIQVYKQSYQTEKVKYDELKTKCETMSAKKQYVQKKYTEMIDSIQREKERKINEIKYTIIEEKNKKEIKEIQINEITKVNENRDVMHGEGYVQRGGDSGRGTQEKQATPDNRQQQLKNHKSTIEKLQGNIKKQNKKYMEMQKILYEYMKKNGVEKVEELKELDHILFNTTNYRPMKEVLI